MSLYGCIPASVIDSGIRAVNGCEHCLTLINATCTPGTSPEVFKGEEAMTNDEAKAKLQEMSTIQCRSVLRLLNNSQEEKKFKPTDIASMKTADCKTNILTRYPKDYAGAIEKVLADAPPVKKKGATPAPVKTPKLDDMGFPIEDDTPPDTNNSVSPNNIYGNKREELLAALDDLQAVQMEAALAEAIKEHTAPLEARIAAIEKLLT